MLKRNYTFQIKFDACPCLQQQVDISKMLAIISTSVSKIMAIITEPPYKIQTSFERNATNKKKKVIWHSNE